MCVKLKFVPVFYLTEHYAMMAYWGVEVWLHASFTSALGGGGLSVSCHDRFTPKETTLFTHWVGGWMGSRADLDTVVKRKIPSPCRDLKRNLPARNPALYHRAMCVCVRAHLHVLVSIGLFIDSSIINFLFLVFCIVSQSNFITASTTSKHVHIVPT
jgi:hypothetical protein